MSKKSPELSEDIALFRKLTQGVRPLLQDRLFFHRQKPRPAPAALVPEQRYLREQSDASHYFSDTFQPLLSSEGPIRYLRHDVSADELKKLRRGNYLPELLLDLHGLTRQQAKRELGALIAACRREHIVCACVMHGHGKQILKQQTPLWLAQHPHIRAFHQAPKAWGGDAALLILLETTDPGNIPDMPEAWR